MSGADDTRGGPTRRPVLRLARIERHYGDAAGRLDVLVGADLDIHPGELVALIAPSGAGKSTLLHVAGLLEQPDGGEVYIAGRPAGRLGDARSRRVVFLAGVALFTLSSALCGAAQSALWISVARVVQGVGGGLITPQVSGFIQNLFKGPERARAFGLFGASIGVSTAIGPLLGGLLVQLGGTDFGWRLVFYVNLPVGLTLLVLGRRWLPAARGGRRSRGGRGHSR